MEKNIDSIINEHMDKGYFPSCVCKVFGIDKTFYNKAFGEVEKDTIFDVASLSKIVTSTEILMLIGDGKLSLDTKLGDCLLSIKKHKNLKQKISDITILQLLTHSSGILDWYPFYSRKETVFDVLDHVVGTYDKVEGVVYSDLNFIILGEVIKYITRLSLEDSLEKFIKQKMSIKNIYYNPMKFVDLEKIAPSSYGNSIEKEMCKLRNISFDRWRNDEKSVVGHVNDGNCYYFFDGVSGHAGVFANVEAYEKICKFYMTSNDDLVKLSMEEITEKRGLGWQVSYMFPNGCGHTGFTGTSIYICKEKNVGVIIFTNRLYTRDESKNLNEFRKRIHDVVYSNF